MLAQRNDNNLIVADYKDIFSENSEAPAVEFYKEKPEELDF